MRRKMCKLWTNFAKFRDPTPISENPLPFRWKSSPMESDNLQYLVIDDEQKTEMVKNLNEDRVKFWRSVYKKYNKNFRPSKL